jgi:hypothetical protein
MTGRQPVSAPDDRTSAERRALRRTAIHGVLLNKYVGGFPFAVSLLDLSETGIRIRKLLEPDSEEARVALEIEVPRTGDRLWLWAREVWRSGSRQALTFSGLTEGDRAMLHAIVASANAPEAAT